MSRFPAMGTAHFCFMEHWILAVSTVQAVQTIGFVQVLLAGFRLKIDVPEVGRSEEHTSELQSRYLISYAVFCLKKKIPERGVP